MVKTLPTGGSLPPWRFFTTRRDIANFATPLHLSAAELAAVGSISLICQHPLAVSRWRRTTQSKTTDPVIGLSRLALDFMASDFATPAVHWRASKPLCRKDFPGEFATSPPLSGSGQRELSTPHSSIWWGRHSCWWGRHSCLPQS